MGADEFRLEYTDVHNEFRQLYESMIEKFIVSQGASVVDFYRDLSEKSQDPTSQEATLGQIMLATTDFDIFMQMMRETRAGLAERKL